MRRQLGTSIAAAVIIGCFSIGSAGLASAAHCNDNGGPGNSDFATHARTASGPGGHNEGDHRGWSSCQETSANYVETSP